MEKVTSFKSVCLKIGLIMTIFTISRTALALTNALMYKYGENLGETGLYIATLILSDLFLYIIPIVSALFIMRKTPLEIIKSNYKRPPRLAKALGNFPAMYGLGQLANYLTLIVFWIISNFQPENVDIEKSFGVMDSIMPPNIICGLALSLRMVFSAALYEEFFARGIIMQALRPYGNGFAIIVSGLLFGAMHGNFQQFFYASIIGIVLGYIAIQTESVLTTTILHASFNSMSAIVMLFLSTETVKDFIAGGFAGGVPDDQAPVLAAFGIYFAFIILLLVAGIMLAFKKIARLKKYKVDNSWTEVAAGKKTLLFIASPAVIIALILTIDVFAGQIIAHKIFEALF